MNPIRLELTMALARELGVLESVEMFQPRAATRAELLDVHTGEYVDAVQEAAANPDYRGFGLGTDDDPIFPGIYEASALLAGGSKVAAQLLATQTVEHAINIGGGLHHAMADRASGFCIFNDIVLAITTLLAGGANRVAYVDIDVHHGDGVQAAFYNDPRVLTVSIHQDPRTLFPGTGLPTEIGAGAGVGTAVNLALPPGIGDASWHSAFNAVIPSIVRAFAPDVLVTQCGCDTHHDDPLANMSLTVDGQREAIAALHRLAHDAAGGRWLAMGGGGYDVVGCVPRTWTNLIAEASGNPLDPATSIPFAWHNLLLNKGIAVAGPLSMGELPPGESVSPRQWEPGGESWLDRAVTATRRASFPLFGLDPYDPRD